MDSLKRCSGVAWYYSLLLLGAIGFASCNDGKTTSNSMDDRNPVNRKNGAISYPLSLSVLRDSLSRIRVKSRNVLLKDPFHGMQTFDFDNEGNIYYSQLSGSARDKNGRAKSGDIVYIIKARPNSPAGENYMTLQYFGHGGTVVVEDTKEGPYVWVSSNATKHLAGGRLESGHYWGARSVSRIKYEKGKTYKGYGGDTYFLNKGEFFVLIAAIDSENKYICFLASKKRNDGIIRNFYTYRLADVKAAPVSTFTFKVKVGGEKKADSVHTEIRTVDGHDLNSLTPLGTFSLLPGKNFSKDVNAYSNQGIEIDSDGYIYFYEGNGPSKKRPQGAYVTVFDLKGNTVEERTQVAAIADPAALFYSGITNRKGAMEAEGIKVVKNKIYLGYSSSLEGQDGTFFRGANIFEYSSAPTH